MGIDGSAGLYRYVLVVGQEWGRLCRAGISFLSAVPTTLLPKVVYFSFSDEMYENMPSDLVEKIKAYNANYQECINSRAFNFSSNEVNQYNQIVKYVNEHSLRNR